MYKTLQVGQVSRVVPIIGTLNPLFLLVYAAIFNELGSNQIFSVLILVAGLVFLTIPTWKGQTNRYEIIFLFLSAILFSVSYIVLRQAYQRDDFFTVFIWARLILIPVGLTIFAIPHFRNKILKHNHKPQFNPVSHIGFLFLGGQAAGGIAQLLLNYSINLANPALVNALQGSQYAFLFFGNIILSHKFPRIFKEPLSFSILSTKFSGLLCIGVGLGILAFASQPQTGAIFGVTYSPRYAQSFGLNPQQTYTQALDELQIKNIRLPVYWDEVEKTPGTYDFSSVDFYLREAEKRQVNVILVIGEKVPRWPECFEPTWATSLPQDQQQQELDKLIKTEVTYFQHYPSISVWQVENEPYFNFGLCQQVNTNRVDEVKQEVTLVKSLDSRPVLITDSGELSNWSQAFQTGDIVGYSLYRTVWSANLGFYVDYPLPPLFYQLKAAIEANLLHKSNNTFVSELQAEPWGEQGKSLTQMSPIREEQVFPPSKIIQNSNYAKETGAKEIYLWGIEWWYYMKKTGHPEYINAAKQVFNP